MSHIDTLNERQKEAVEHTEGPLLVLAGAGSGKTRVITHRILHLIEKGVPPEHILAVTFTNKAAKEMRERVMSLMKESLPAERAVFDRRPTVSTFHSLGVMMLRENHSHLGLKRHFTIYDRSDSQKAIKAALEKAGYSPKQFEPRKILGIISRAKGSALTRLEFTDSAHSYIEGVAAEVWEHYEQSLKENHALDFDDLLLETLEILKRSPEIRKTYQERFKYIHVDEYQDTNAVQYEIIRSLSGENQNICVVGDVDQNIYSWRGADLNNILQFEKHFENAKVVLLEENYRSTQTIITVSNDIITKNKNRFEKTVFTQNQDGDALSLYAAFNENDEAEHIATTANELIENGAAPSSLAVLFRANFQSRALEDAFLTRSIPYQVLGVRFFERKEIKDMLSFLRLSLNRDSVTDLSRIINVPPRGIGKVTLLKIVEGRQNEITGSTKTKVDAFHEMMVDIAEAVQKKRLSEALKFILKRTGLEETLKKGGDEELERLENIRELVSLAIRYDDLPGTEGAEKLLEDAALQSDQDELASNPKEESETVKLMTVHAAKGLEFPYVFITGLEEGLFPHERITEDRVDDEEERRLFYVALTRAEKKVFLSFAGVRTVFGSQRVNVPSSFLSDIDDTFIEEADPRESGYETVIEIE